MLQKSSAAVVIGSLRVNGFVIKWEPSSRKLHDFPNALVCVFVRPVMLVP